MIEGTRIHHHHRREEEAPPSSVALPAPGATAPGRASPNGLGHSIGNLVILPKLEVTAADDQYEREADQTAARVAGELSADRVEPATPGPVQRVSAPAGSPPPGAPAGGGLAVSPEVEQSLESVRGTGAGLPAEVRHPMERAFGADFTGVRVHTDGRADAFNQALGARAFTTRSEIFFRAGEYGPDTKPGRELLAHELTHVLQQGAAVQRKPLVSAAPSHLLQRDLAQSLPTANGGFEMSMLKREGALNTPATPSGMAGEVRFRPSAAAPYSNQIALIQIVKLTDAGGANVSPVSLPRASAPNLRTTADPATGVQDGFFTDVLHQGIPGAPGPANPQGSPLPPQYAFGHGPANPSHGGFPTNTLGAGGQTFGFKRSDTDLKAAELFDAPGTASPTANLDFRFETVAKGEDVMVVYGSLIWGFNLRAGKVLNEHASVQEGTSATFDAALQKHRDFYVHEPLTFYFDFDSDVLPAAELAKIDATLTYLARPDVRVHANGFADLAGGASAHNVRLSKRREQTVRKALTDKGIDAARIELLGGHGASAHATTDATTPQADEANRRGNRRVELTFTQVPTPAVAPAAPGAGAAGAGGP